MNRVHRRYCRSQRWSRTVAHTILPPALAGCDLGDNLLEVGPGPGVTTDLLRGRVSRLTALEIDPRLASALERRLRHTNVTVVHGDASRIPFADDTFSGAVCFTMLHHVPSVSLQDRVLAELHRVLQPGGVLAGSDSLGGTWFFRLIHLFDTRVLVDPATLPQRLAQAGFGDISVHAQGRLRFQARKL